MDPIHFPEVTDTLAKAQPQYRVLPICVQHQNPLDPRSIKKMTCKYQLSDLELEQVNRTKSFYISQFGDVYHPIYPQIDNPYLVCRIEYKVNEDGSYTLFIPMEDKQITEIRNIPLNLVLDTCLKVGGNLTAEHLVFIPKPTLGIDNQGNLKMM